MTTLAETLFPILFTIWMVLWVAGFLVFGLERKLVWQFVLQLIAMLFLGQVIANISEVATALVAR